ncbi:Alanyl-Trna Editing Protein Aarsd1 [Manis pentadactyla]|nr:Alanyl-Trna Editing Protein Aarsd1 [Manis pentadactyla]
MLKTSRWTRYHPRWLLFFLLPLAPHEAVGSSTSGPRAGNDTQDEPMDTTPPSMAIIFRWTPTPHGAMRSTTAGLLCTSDNHRAGVRRLSSPGPLRCSGRHRRRPRPYPMHNKPWASPPLASCASQTPTAQAVNVWSPMDPQDDVGGTDDGLGPTPKSDDDPMGTPQPWEWHLQMTPSPRQGHGQYKSRP